MNKPVAKKVITVAMAGVRKRFWLVTVGGRDSDIGGPRIETTTIETWDEETPIDWFADNPKVYHNLTLVIHTMIGFWEVSKKQYMKLNSIE